jgi:enterochelin esterase family protein
MKRIITISSTLLLIPCLLFAQGEVRPVSPEVHPDNTVTFRFIASNAQSVELSAQFLTKNMPMKKNANGVWEVTTKAIKPDIYPYNFIVNGSISVADPNNMNIFANERFKNSLVDVKGQTPLIHSMQAVPHGKIQYRFYESKTLGHTRPLVIYTPPGYDPSSSVTYPVLYLIHGATDTHETWYKVGRINLILDNLIAQGKAKKMIIVMPYANPNKTWGQGSNAEAQQPMTQLAGRQPNFARIMGIDLFVKEMLNDVIPYTETNFRVKIGRDDRAIAGFSRGGGQTLAAGMGHPEVFGWVCGYAPALFGVDEAFKNTYAPIDQLKTLKILNISCGKDDGLYKVSQELIKRLKKEGIKHETFYTTGGHTWMNCKLFVAHTVQQLF